MPGLTGFQKSDNPVNPSNPVILSKIFEVPSLLLGRDFPLPPPPPPWPFAACGFFSTFFQNPLARALTIWYYSRRFFGVEGIENLWVRVHPASGDRKNGRLCRPERQGANADEEGTQERFGHSWMTSSARDRTTRHDPKIPACNPEPKAKTKGTRQ